MFFRRHLFLVVSVIASAALAAIHDEDYLNNNGPLGLMAFEKNDTYVDWVRVPEISYDQWIYALKVWRTVSVNRSAVADE